MSNVSIYDKNWTELVFEDKNKAYGAYQLRQENSRTTLLAFFVGTSLILALIGSWFLLSSFTGKVECPIDEPINPKIVTVDLTQKPPAQPLGSKAPPIQPQNPIKQPNLSHMVVAATPQAQDNIPTNADIKIPSNDTGDVTGPAVDTPIISGSPAGTPLAPAVDNGVKIGAELDRLPEYPGGIKKFYEYVLNNVEESKFENSSGIVSVTMAFVIEKDGSMTDIRVVRGSDKSLEKEAIRVLKSLKVKWSPGFLNGEKMRTQYTLPIKVDLN